MSRLASIIRSNKHLLQVTLTTVNEGVIDNTILVDVKHSDVQGQPTNVDVGDTVKAVYVELWVLATGQQPATFNITLEKVVNSADPLATLDAQNLQAYPNKKNILYTTQGLIGDANSNPTPVMRGWFKIPKGKQRFGLGDRLFLNIKAITDNIQYCGIIIFKSYN